MLISEQLAKNEVLVKDNARLQSELTEIQGESFCVVCRDATKSEAFVPCGHICVCEACYDRVARERAGSFICPTCRREVCFAVRVYVWTKQGSPGVDGKKEKTMCAFWHDANLRAFLCQTWLPGFHEAEQIELLKLARARAFSQQHGHLEFLVHSLEGSFLPEILRNGQNGLPLNIAN